MEGADGQKLLEHWESRQSIMKQLATRQIIHSSKRGM
jgi:hypothetical protein